MKTETGYYETLARIRGGTQTRPKDGRLVDPNNAKSRTFLVRPPTDCRDLLMYQKDKNTGVKIVSHEGKERQLSIEFIAAYIYGRAALNKSNYNATTDRRGLQGLLSKHTYGIDADTKNKGKPVRIFWDSNERKAVVAKLTKMIKEDGKTASQAARAILGDDTKLVVPAVILDGKTTFTELLETYAVTAESLAASEDQNGGQAEMEQRDNATRSNREAAADESGTNQHETLRCTFWGGAHSNASRGLPPTGDNNVLGPGERTTAAQVGGTAVVPFGSPNNEPARFRAEMNNDEDAPPPSPVETIYGESTDASSPSRLVAAPTNSVFRAERDQKIGHVGNVGGSIYKNDIRVKDNAQAFNGEVGAVHYHYNLGNASDPELQEEIGNLKQELASMRRHQQQNGTARVPEQESARFRATTGEFAAAATAGVTTASVPQQDPILLLNCWHQGCSLLILHSFSTHKPITLH